MKICENCGTPYSDACTNCDKGMAESEKGSESSLLPFDNTDTESNGPYDIIHITVGEKIVGLCSLAGVAADVVLGIIFSNKLHYVPEGIVMASRQNYLAEIQPVLFLSILSFIFCCFLALFPWLLWLSDVRKIRRLANVDDDITPSDLWLAYRKLGIVAAFTGAIATLIISIFMFNSALVKTKEDEIYEQYFNEIYYDHVVQELQFVLSIEN